MDCLKTKITILTWPNFVTTIRLILTPFFLQTVIHDKDISVLLFFIIAISDLLDGFLARKLRQETYFGKLFDGFTDTFFLFLSLIVLTLLKRLNVILLLFLLSPRLVVFLNVVYKKIKFKEISYKTTVYRKISAIFNFLLILLSLFKYDISVEAMIVVMISYVTRSLEWIIPKLKYILIKKN